jgi:hypothetical protein
MKCILAASYQCQGFEKRILTAIDSFRRVWKHVSVLGYHEIILRGVAVVLSKPVSWPPFENTPTLSVYRPRYTATSIKVLSNSHGVVPKVSGISVVVAHGFCHAGGIKDDCSGLVASFSCRTSIRRPISLLIGTMSRSPHLRGRRCCVGGRTT